MNHWTPLQSFALWLWVSQLFAQDNDIGIEPAVDAGFLTNTVRDSLNLFGAFGVAITAIGFFVGIYALWLTLKQMERTTDAATAATLSAVQAREENKTLYNRYIIANAAHMLDAAKMFVLNEQWSHAAIRIGDLARLAGQLGLDSPQWKDFADQLRAMEISFDRIGKNEIQFRSLRPKWHALQLLIRSNLDTAHTPILNRSQSNDESRHVPRETETSSREDETRAGEMEPRRPL